MGTKTLLNSVNDVLKKCESIDSDGALTSLTDSARQAWIDNAVLAVNETVDLLYSLPEMPNRPQQVSSASITLAAGDQDYALSSSLVQLLPEFGLIDSTNNHVISIDPDPDAYRRLIVGDLEQDDTGLPSVCCIRPTDGQLWMDRAPTASEAGREYTYRFETDNVLTAYDDTFPFTDMVYRSLIVAATEQYRRINHREYDEKYMNRWLAIAAQRMTMTPARTSVRGYPSANPTDPFEASA